VWPQVTTGIQALPRGQRMAGAALGLTPVQTYRYVLLPMAFRIIIPALTNEFAAIIKNSSVALTIGLVELTAATYSMREFTFQTFEALTGATIIYLIISVIALFMARLLEKIHGRSGLHHRRQHQRRRALIHVQQFRFRRHPALVGLPLHDGPEVHAHPDLLGHAGRDHPGHAAGHDAPVVQQAAVVHRDHLRQPDPLHSAGAGDLLVLLPGALHRRLDHRCLEPIQVGAFQSALITFILFEAAYYCEIMRSGIQSIPRGQVFAGYAIGMNYWQMMGNVVLPQAFRNMTPILLTQTIVLFQDVSLVYVLGSVPDFVTSASKIAQRDGRLVEMYLFVAVVYFAELGLSTLVKRFQKKIAIIR
jgi:ABC-type amino acid transport system permease subunit